MGCGGFRSQRATRVAHTHARLWFYRLSFKTVRKEKWTLTQVKVDFNPGKSGLFLR